MPKPVCVPCKRFYRCKKNEFNWIEGAPDGPTEDGRPVNGQWVPYRLWSGDLWHCLSCGHELVVGHGSRPLSERHHPDFAEQLAWERTKAVAETKTYGFDLQLILVEDC